MEEMEATTQQRLRFMDRSIHTAQAIKPTCRYDSSTGLRIGRLEAHSVMVAHSILWAFHHMELMLLADSPIRDMKTCSGPEKANKAKKNATGTQSMIIFLFLLSTIISIICAV